MARRRGGKQADLFEEEEADRALIDQLIADTRLYDTAPKLKALLDFTARLRNIAPFNAMLLNVQKPGLTFAASRDDWARRFGRKPKPEARPLVVLRLFGPVDFVYDVQDLEGNPLPADIFSFPTEGEVPKFYLEGIARRLSKFAIDLRWIDSGDASAGHAVCRKPHGDKTRFETFDVGVNRNHQPATKVVTLAHELAHIYLGHCGGDAHRKVASYRPASLAIREVEAETVAYVVARRTALKPLSEDYLQRYQGAFEEIDVHRILKVALAVEKALDLPFMEVRPFGPHRWRYPTLNDR